MKAEVRPIIITLENEEKYTLEYTRDSVRNSEKRGFVLKKREDYFTFASEIFFNAFYAHHPDMTIELADKIADEIGGISDAMVDRLVDLYTAAYTSLFADEEKQKNSKARVEM